MRAATLTAEDALCVGEVSDPRPGPDEVLLRVDLAGVCGTDLNALAAGIAVGTVLGHEFTGTVIEAGAGVGDRIATGRRVVAMPTRSCGRCAACILGDLIHCASARLVGNQPDAPGGFAERVVVGIDSVIVLPDSVPARAAALVEPLAVALHIVRRSGLAGSDNVLVVGAGPIGLAVTLWARHLGAHRVVVSDPQAARRDMAVDCGATDVLDPGADSVGQAWRGLKLAVRPDLVIECTGRSAVLQQCLGVLPRLGRLTVSGMHSHPVPLDLTPAYFKELTVGFSSWYRREDFQYTVDMVATGRLDVSGVRTEVVGLSRLPEAFAAQRRPSAVAKLLVDPHG
jgi:(R,R)-butanediol dehydrogenase/meso-butanediol dehydrogenase/diacetyl reductase